MGNVKMKSPAGRIAFHVGKEMPERGGDVLLVPGVQNAQGRGVYFSDDPQFKYAGGEHYRKEVERTPVFVISLQGKWASTNLRKKGGMAVYHSAGKLLLFRNIQFFDSEIGEEPVRYYFSDEVAAYQEPAEQDRETSVIWRFREGKLRQEEVLAWLQTLGVEAVDFDAEVAVQKMQEAVSEGRFSPVAAAAISERFGELKRERENRGPMQDLADQGWRR